MKTKEFTFVNDCFHDESNAVVDVFLLTLHRRFSLIISFIIWGHYCPTKFYHLG